MYWCEISLGMRYNMAKENNNKYSFFSHKSCEFFPCHQGINNEEFNCLFCFCPLYALGDKCGGNFKYTDDGKKDCSDCLIPHKRENYDKIISKCEDIMILATTHRCEHEYNSKKET